MNKLFLFPDDAVEAGSFGDIKDTSFHQKSVLNREE
jgi:hypothetical protein